MCRKLEIPFAARSLINEDLLFCCIGEPNGDRRVHLKVCDAVVDATDLIDAHLVRALPGPQISIVFQGPLWGSHRFVSRITSILFAVGLFDHSVMVFWFCVDNFESILGTFLICRCFFEFVASSTSIGYAWLIDYSSSNVSIHSIKQSSLRVSWEWLGVFQKKFDFETLFIVLIRLSNFYGYCITNKK